MRRQGNNLKCGLDLDGTVPFAEAAGVGAPEIEITPAMIKARASAFLDFDNRFEREAGRRLLDF
jgi:hypothetical protein